MGQGDKGIRAGSQGTMLPFPSELLLSLKFHEAGNRKKSGKVVVNVLAVVLSLWRDTMSQPRNHVIGGSLTVPEGESITITVGSTAPER